MLSSPQLYAWPVTSDSSLESGAIPIAEEVPAPRRTIPPTADADPDALSITLMGRIKSGDCAAFERLVALHQNAVIGTVAKMLGDVTEAHDIAQQVFLRVWKSAHRYRPSAKFTTWLFTITRNLVFNETRRRSRRKTISADAQEEEYQLTIPDTKNRTPDEESLNNELWRAIDAAIAALPARQRMAVILRRYENMPYGEIATVLSVSGASVKSLLFRARAELKEKLQEYLDA